MQISISGASPDFANGLTGALASSSFLRIKGNGDTSSEDLKESRDNPIN
jgi:hypothetical protein